MFLLEFKFHQQRSEILKTPFWEATKRVKQLMKYYDEKNKAMENETSKIKT